MPFLVFWGGTILYLTIHLIFISFPLLFIATNGNRWFARLSDENKTKIQDTLWMTRQLHECYWFTKTDFALQPPCFNLENSLRNLPSASWQTFLSMFDLGRHDLQRLELFQPGLAVPVFHNDDKDSLNGEEIEPMESYDDKTKDIYPMLKGTIPNEITLLTLLSHINLANQQLHGSIPLDMMLEKFTELQSLVLANNSLSGPLPDMRPYRSLVKELILGPNLGLEPSNLNIFPVYLPALEILDVHATHRTGTIPPTMMDDLYSIQKIDFSQNELTGPIPSEVIVGRPNGAYNNYYKGNLLSSLNLANNELSGMSS